MANEISVQCKMTCRNGLLYIAKGTSFSADQATAGGGQPGTVAVTTSDAAISISGITTPRMAYFRNLGDNPVDIGPTSGGAIVPFARLLPGEAMVVPLKPSVALRAQTTTSTSTLEIVVLET